MTVTTTDLALPGRDVEADAFSLDQRRAKAYAESGYWPDASKLAQALVKIEAGRYLGLSPFIAMTEVHVIDGKPSLGAGGHAALVKAHPRYDYRVVQLTDEVCEIAFYEAGAHVGTSTFRKSDAQQAGLLGRGPWKQYPRNMLFARAMSNGVAWFAPDVTMGRIYLGDEIDAQAPPPALPDEAFGQLLAEGVLVEVDDEDIPFGELSVEPAEELP